MELQFFLFTLAVTGFLWIVSIVSTFNKRTFWKYFLINSLVFGVYSYFWIYYSEIITGNDSWDFGKIYGYVMILICHSSLGFIILRFERNKINRTT